MYIVHMNFKRKRLYVITKKKEERGGREKRKKKQNQMTFAMKCM